MTRVKDVLRAAAKAKLDALKLEKCFDPNDLDSRPNEAQTKFHQDAEHIKFRYLIGGNGSGKSQTGGRELTWLINDTHPYWDMPESWKGRPLQILVIGKSRSIIENELWDKKIKPLLNKADWRENRSANTLGYVEHRGLGHKIIFLSHADGSRKSIDNLQAYDADIVWVDEMPAKQEVLEETQRRTRREGTLWFATFTPKSVSIKIRKQVDAAKEPVAKRYKMSRLDVPGVDKERELLALEGQSESQKRTILFGDWAVGDEHVFNFDADFMLTDLPEDYSRKWRHVECVDPGSNRGGFTIWAEHPKTFIWYCIHAEYIDGLRDPVAFYQRCQELTKPYRIVRRICDPASTSHLGHAAAEECTPPYMSPYAKNQGRKNELIKNFQSALSAGTIKLVENRCSEFIDELQNAQWNSAGSKIVNSHAYHLADCGQYFVDLIPKPVDSPIGKTRDEYILEQDDKRRAQEAVMYQKQQKKMSKKQSYQVLRRLQTGRRFR